jgi:hypothetical protein
LPWLQCFFFWLKGKPVVFFYAALDVSRDSLGYYCVAFKANAYGSAVDFQLHQRIKSVLGLALTTAVAASVLSDVGWIQESGWDGGAKALEPDESPLSKGREIPSQKRLTLALPNKDSLWSGNGFRRRKPWNGRL